MRTNRALGTALALATAVAAPGLASAICGLPITFGQSLPACAGAYCYVISPVSAAGASAGSFWALGFGDPATGTGDDNGTFPCSEWCRPWEPGCYLAGDWAGDQRIDGCIQGKISDTRCAGPCPSEVMVALLADADPYVGCFAVAAVQHNFQGMEYEFGALGQDIRLVPMPKPRIVGTHRVPPTGVMITMASPEILDGYYTDGTAPRQSVITHYRVYRQSVDRGRPAPSTRERSAWVAVFTVALGQPYTMYVDASTNADTFLAYTLILDSGYETPFVSQNSSRIQYGPILAEPQPRFELIDRKRSR